MEYIYIYNPGRIGFKLRGFFFSSTGLESSACPTIYRYMKEKNVYREGIDTKGEANNLVQIPFFRSNHQWIIATMLDCGLELSDFELQLRYYVHFQTNTLGKCMNNLIPSPQLIAKVYHCYSSIKMALAIKNSPSL